MKSNSSLSSKGAPGRGEHAAHRSSVGPEGLARLQEVVARRHGSQRVGRRVGRVLLEHLAGVLVLHGAVVHAEGELRLQRESQKLQARPLAAGHGQPRRVGVVVEHPVRLAPQLVAAPGELLAVEQGESQLQQVDTAHAEGVQAHKESLHELQLAGHHGHLHHDVGNGADGLLYETQRALDVGWAPVGLDAEPDLGKPRVAQPPERFVGKPRAARVQARVHAGEQLAGAPEEGHGLVGVQQGARPR